MSDVRTSTSTVGTSAAPSVMVARSDLDRWRRASAGAWLVGGVALAAALVWGCLVDVEVEPTLPVPRDESALVGPSDATKGSRESLAAASFDRRLAPAPPPPPVTAKEESKDGSRFSRFELVAISSQGGELVAAIFDPVRQSLFLVKSGGTIDATVITAIEPREVRLSEGARTRTLRLVTAKERSDGKAGGA
jgi:hypothetical protein